MFKRKANEIFSELSKLIPQQNFELALNEDGKPKRGEIKDSFVRRPDFICATYFHILGSFEIFVVKTGTNKKVQIWSGVAKGPPRKDKFPEPKSLVEAVTNAIKD